ncbi:MAG TPA: NifB/NifX family molybdenum-iron cluster-binding protein [Terracidiphilus sp.]|nr:NifB/NifX family molybdenum-iron cluster-binding protein [Terracidiphilus sp.]
MKLAIAVSGDRVANALDFARRLLLVDCEGGREISRSEAAVVDKLPLNRARFLAALGVEVLICGAVSRFLAESLVTLGIRIVPFVSGSVAEVLNAYFEDGLESGRLLMPGSTEEDRQEWTKAGHQAAAK